MTTLTVTLPAGSGESQVAGISRSSTGYWTELNVPTRIGLSTEGQENTLWLPYAPREVSYDGIGTEWSEQERDGVRKPLLVASGKKLKSMNFSVELVRPEWNQSVESVLDKLIYFADSQLRVYVHYSKWENGFWRIQNMKVSSSMRSDLDNSITRATVDLDFIEASDVVRITVPATGGTKAVTTSPPKPAPPRIPKYYVTKRGDTLQSLGLRYFKSHTAWKRIAKLNRIKYPRQKFKAGRRLRLL